MSVSSSFPIQRSMLDVRCSTCPQCLETGVDQFNHLIYISKFTPTHRAMHGRRVFIFLVPPAPFLIFRIFSRGIVPPYRTTTGPTSEFLIPLSVLNFEPRTQNLEPLNFNLNLNLQTRERLRNNFHKEKSREYGC
jgi:hypothetical protein